MQVTETLNEGLKRELKVVVPAKDLNSSLDKKIDDIKDRVQLKGFRQGKVPVEHLKRVYGRGIMSEIVQETVTETSKKAIEDRNEKPAFQPQIAFTEDEKEIEQVMEGKEDLAYSLTFEIVPNIELADFSKIAVTKEVAEVPEKEVDEAIERIAAQNRPFAAKADDAKAEDGDRVTIDFAGKIDGEPFDGGSAEDAPLVLGSNQFIPGFEEQLVGVKKGDEKTITVKFPDEYQAAHLAGKEATFDVKVKEVAAPGDLKIDDEFAKQLGMESLDKVKEAVREQMSGELNQASREKLKRAVLDELDKAHTFELPPTLVDQEFEQIFGQLKQDMEQAGETFEKDGTTEEEAAKNYREIAERRVRLGLVLAETAEKNKIEVSEEEVNNALRQQIQRYPGQEQQVLDYFKQNPQAVAQLRAPIFEDKVIDFILELAKVSDKKVSREHLLHHDHGHDHDHDHGHDHDHEHGGGEKKKPAKKAAKKKAPAKKSG